MAVLVAWLCRIKSYIIMCSRAVHTILPASTTPMGERQARGGRKKRGHQRYSIFLSHSSRDQWLARVIAEKIQAVGVKVWLDEMSLTSGENIVGAVMNGIEKTHEVLVLVSNESLRSQWVAAEIGMALAKRKRITPLLNNVDYDAMAPLKGVKSYELNLFEKFLSELKGRAAKHGRT